VRYIILFLICSTLLAQDRFEEFSKRHPPVPEPAETGMVMGVVALSTFLVVKRYKRGE